MGIYEFTRATLVDALQRGASLVEDGTYELIPGWIGSARTWTANPIRETSGYEVAFRTVFPGDNSATGDYRDWGAMATWAGNGARIGAWTDPDTGVTWIDYTIHVANREHAIELGREFHQLAIWDWAAGETISIDDENNETGV
jgi:hypothetical protein